MPIVTAYKGSQIVSTGTITWTASESGIVQINGNEFSSLGEGVAVVTGSCVIEGVSYSVDVTVEVYRPTIEIDEHFEIEIEAIEELNVTSTILGISREVLYNGETVGVYDSQSKAITLNRGSFPKTASSLGEDRVMSIETNLASYEFSVDVYTKIIKTKADLENMAVLSKACSQDPAIWDGYFVLGADIEYGGLFQSRLADISSLWSAVGGSWFNGCLYGFKGVLDGKGHVIDGLKIDNGNEMGAFCGVLHVDGVIKNITFTNASVCANSSLVCGAGGGTVENIYIEYESLGKGTQRYEGDGSINNYTSSFFGYKEPTLTASVSNCVIDVTNAHLDTNTALKVVGSEYATIKNVFVIGGTQDVRDKSNATMAFGSVVEFLEDANAQNRYAKFDGAFWSLTAGVPVSYPIYGKICDGNVSFNEEIAYLALGTQYRFDVDNEYAIVTTDCNDITIRGGVATVSESATVGQTVTVTVTSVFNPEKTESYIATLMSLATSFEDLTAESTTAFYDLTEGKVYLAELSQKISGDILYYVNDDLTAPTFSSGDGESVTVLGVAQDKLYKVTCESVTKVIDSADDLHHVRRDYTVTSYNNRGCYDGAITGKFVLINDIDCTGLVLEDSGTYWENSRGFGGIFDGRGYTISNLSVSKNGLFGTLSFATVKNVNFEGVRLKANSDGSGAYVALFANSVYNTTVDNVDVHYAEYVYVDGGNVSSSSGLLFHEKSFDSIFTNVTLDITDVSNVVFVTEYSYGSDVPYGSDEKSVYDNVKVVVANSYDLPAFAYNGDDEVEYPDGVTLVDDEGNPL